MLILDAEAVRQALPMKSTIEAMKSAFAALSAGHATVPLRSRLEIPERQATNLFMPAYVNDGSGESLGLKIVTVYPENAARGLPLINGAVIVLDPHSGRPLAMLEGAELTAIRTGAGAGAATDLLARADSRIAAIIGTGAQAQTQLTAICTVRELAEVRIFSRTADHVAAFISQMQPEVEARLVAAASAAQAVQGADIICAATTSSEPVYDDRDLAPGAHVNGVGSYAPGMVETPPESLARSRVAVDSVESCRAEAGELIRAVELKHLSWDSVSEIGSIAAGRAPGRQSAAELTYFKSVGVAVQDAAAARLALENAQNLGLGQSVSF